jgi:inositol hexakisphosphate/diphosphoinositol-pentakisphosphate kinase
LFEDIRRDADDPRRYRVEMLFSPGATATPMHMAELERDSDMSRFETDGLRMISREGLTCQELEDFFTVAITAGKPEDHRGEYPSIAVSVEDLKKNRKAELSKAAQKKLWGKSKQCE